MSSLDPNMSFRPLTVVPHEINPSEHTQKKGKIDLQIKSSNDEKPILLEAFKRSPANFFKTLSKENIKIQVETPEGKKQKVYVNIEKITDKLGITPDEIKTAKKKGKGVLENLLVKKARELTKTERPPSYEKPRANTDAKTFVPSEAALDSLPESEADLPPFPSMGSDDDLFPQVGPEDFFPEGLAFPDDEDFFDEPDSIIEEKPSPEKQAEMQRDREIIGNYSRILKELGEMDPNQSLITNDQELFALMNTITAAVKRFHGKTEIGTHETKGQEDIKFRVTYDPKAAEGEKVKLLAVKKFIGIGTFGIAYRTVYVLTKQESVEKESYINYKFMAKFVKAKIADPIFRPFDGILRGFVGNPTAETLSICLKKLEEMHNPNAKKVAAILNELIQKPEADVRAEATNLMDLNLEGKVWGIQEIPSETEHTVQQIVPSGPAGATGKMVVRSVLYDGDYHSHIKSVEIDRSEAGKVKEKKQCLYEAFQLIAGLAYAHSKNYIHGDIKPENIFVKKTGVTQNGVEIVNLAIADWAGAKRIGETSGPSVYTPGFCTTADRDLAKLAANIDQQAADVYALGKTILIRILGREFDLLSTEDSTKRSDNLTKMKDDLGYSEKFINLLQEMIADEPEDRSDILDLLGELIDIIKAEAPEVAALIYQQLNSEEFANSEIKDEFREFAPPQET